jgi:hypothetical protein
LKLLFENWRQYLKESLSEEDIEQAIEKASFNSAKGSQHRWGRGRAIIDYTMQDGDWVYTASFPNDTNNWPMINSEIGEDIEAFLDRIEGPNQLGLPFKNNSFTGVRR